MGPNGMSSSDPPELSIPFHEGVTSPFGETEDSISCHGPLYAQDDFKSRAETIVKYAQLWKLSGVRNTQDDTLCTSPTLRQTDLELQNRANELPTMKI